MTDNNTNNNATNDESTVELECCPIVAKGCSSVNVSFYSSEPLRIEQLIIPRERVADFLITDIKVGKDSQFIGTGCLPASVFSSGAILEPISGLPLLMPDRSVVLSVTNQAASEKVFMATLRCSRLGKTIFPGRGWGLLGLGSTLVVAGGSARIHVQSTAVFHIDRLIVPSSICDSFQVIEIEVGSPGFSVSRTEKVNPASGESFAETSSGQLKFKKALMPGAWLSIYVKNVSSRAENFQGAFAGCLDRSNG